MVIRRKLKLLFVSRSFCLTGETAAAWQSSLISVDVGKNQRAVPVVVEEVPQVPASPRGVTVQFDVQVNYS